MTFDPNVLQSVGEGTREGQSELWLDPLGNEATLGECALFVDDGTIEYTWTREGNLQRGWLLPDEDGLKWADAFHQPEAVECAYVSGARGLFVAEYSYPAPPGPDWGWRIGLSQRPDDTLVLQMTNIAPWGEEARAVRMVFSKPR